MSEFVKNRARPEVFSLKPYVPGKPIEEVQRELGLDDIIKMASNENPLGSSPRAVAAVTAAMGQMHMYPDANCFELKNKLAAINGLNPQNILIGNGSDEILMLLAAAFLNRGDQVIYGDPTFSAYEFSGQVMGAKETVIPLQNFTFDLKAMSRAINAETKLVFICNPNNPTGTIVREPALDQFMQLVPEEVLVVFDEAYAEYVEDPAFISGLKYVKAGRNAVVLHTFSKIYGLAALRVGYALSNPEIVQAAELVSQPFNVNRLAQAGALAALEDIEHVQHSRVVNSAGKQYLYREFEKLGLNYVPTEANFIFVDTGRDCRDVFDALLRMGVIIRKGDVFGHPTYIRVSIGTAAQNGRLIKSLTQVLAK